MKERPILFSAPMVRAILEDRKTQTRRVCRGQRELSCIHDFRLDQCPYGQLGDRLWVRETYSLESAVEDEAPPFSDGRPLKRRPESDWECIAPLWMQPHYRATDPAPDLCCENEHCAQCRDHDMGPHWRPSIFMPRWASRILLEVTDVRVQRVQDISAADAVAEGISMDFHDSWAPSNQIRAFKRLWDSINAPRGFGWDANPWVWAITFRRIEDGTRA